MKQLIMPPFVSIEVPSGVGHDSEKQRAVALGLGIDAGIAMVRQRREGVELGAHGERPAVPVDERQIDGDAARMWRSAPGVGEKLRIRRMRPKRPLRLARAHRIEDPETEPEPARQHQRPVQRRPGIAMEKASRRPINRSAGEIVFRGISEIDIDFAAIAGNFNEIHGSGSGIARGWLTAPL